MKQLKHCAAIAATLLFCANTNAQIVINEYSSSTSTFLDEYKEESDWIELCNTSADEVDLKGWHLSDDKANPGKWTFPSVKIPAGGYLLVMASGKDLTTVADSSYLHTNFNISSDGEAIFLVNAADSIVHQTDTLPVPCNSSRGLSLDSTKSWVFFAIPTPGAANTTQGYATSTTTTVKFSPEGGFQSSALTVTLSTEGNTPIYYTLDCTEPTACDSLLYTGPIEIDSTTVIRAITFNGDLMPGQPSTQTYIFPERLHMFRRSFVTGEISNIDTVITYPNVILNSGITEDEANEFLRNGGDISEIMHDTTIHYTPHIIIPHSSQFNLPVISLTTAPDNLWNYNTGIYVFGPEFSYEEPYYGANFHQEWERPVHVELYWTDGEKRLDQDAGFKIAGAWSRSNDQKSFSLHARNAYGKKYFEAKLFDEIDITRFKSFVLRDSGNDCYSTHFRDALITQLVAKNNVDIQAYQPAVVFLNGEYWGILNIREKLNEYYVESHYPHVDHDKVDLLAVDGSKGMAATEGDMTDYNAMMDFIQSHDLTIDANYQQVVAQIDVDEYIEYLVSEIYGGNDDWPHNNVKMWKSKKNGGRWRWMLYDTDQSYNIWDRTEDKATYDKLGKCLSEKGKNGDTWSNVMLRNMVKNTTFRNELSNRFADRMNREFLPKNIAHMVDSLYNNIKEEREYHDMLWGIEDPTGSSIKSFAKSRPTYMRKQLRKHFDVGDDVVVTLNENDSKAGYIELNSLTLKKFPWSGSYFTNVPVSLRAVARPGYKFVRWENTDRNDTTISTQAGITLTLATNASIKAVFEPDGSSLYNSVVINEINCKSADDFDTKDWIELYNTTAAAINLSGWKISDEKPENAYTIPAGTVIEPYGYLVICENQNKLLKLNPSVTNYVGDFEFGLGKDDKVQLFDSEGTLIDEVAYSKEWGDANGSGKTLALTDPFAENGNAKFWNDNDMHGTPGAQNGLFKPSHTDFNSNERVFIDTIPSQSSNPGQNVDIADAQTVSTSAFCYPNPVSNEGVIAWRQSADANVRIELFNAFGSGLAQICNEWFAQGRHDIDISSTISNCLPGLYVARITIEGQVPVNVRIIKQ